LVLDVDGNPLEVGSEYYIGRAVGFYVVERFSEVDRGDPLSSDVQIDSGLSAYCRSDGFWGVPPSSFRIEKTEGFPNAYKIAYSPPTTSSQQQRYPDLHSGLNLVGLTDDSARVVL
uniref:Kunitz-type trypsin inhibitor 1 (Fragments) n=1 Tax=Selenicereus undatus TaxID=176265 RepID=KTI1_SELUD|nr:RecName: Full=Kunitz-type trypsin inhibitor 1 [Selenicereus undatus]